MLLDQPKLEQLQQTLPADVQPLITQMIDTLRDALSHSLTVVFLAGTSLVVVAMILSFFLREIPLRTSNKMPEPEVDAV
jgi:ABC-type Fe3+ transport system permease subunit